MTAEIAEQTVCVLGFGRSGTSLTARLLNLLGVSLGSEQDLLPAQEIDNRLGYWEPTWMVDLNDEILDSLGTTWWQPFPAGRGWEQASELAPLRARARELFDGRLGGAPLRGWKDPRTTLTLPFWREVVPDLQFVICLRNPIESVASLQRRPEPTLPVRAWGELWLEYTARALMETAGAPRLLIFYDDFFRDGAAQLDRIASFIGTTPSDERRAEALAFIDGDSRHHSASLSELAVDPGAPAAARAAFLALRAGHSLRQAQGTAADEVPGAIERVVPELWWESRNGRPSEGPKEPMTEDHEAAMAQLAERLGQVESVVQAHATTLERAADASRLADTERRAASAETQLERIEQSLSWRMTSALRAARRGAVRLSARRRG